MLSVPGFLITLAAAIAATAQPAGHTALPHPVNIHALLTKVAVQGSSGFRAFLSDHKLGSDAFDSGRVKFPTDFSRTHISGELLRELGKGFSFDERPADLVVVGAVGEDDGNWPANHFREYQHGNKSISVFYDNAYDWANSKQSGGFHWTDAIQRYHDAGIAATRNQRLAATARMLVDVGHVLHLVQDMSQPSHTRGDAHICDHRWYGGITGCSELERWGNDHAMGSAKALMGLQAGEPYQETLLGYFDRVAKFSATEFFSDDTFTRGNLPGSVVMIDPDCQYAVNDGLNANTRVGRVSSRLFCTPHFCVNLPCTPQALVANSVMKLDTAVVEDNASHLYPRAASVCARVLDHFFRGRLELDFEKIERDQSGTFVTYKVTNVSAAPGATAEQLTLADAAALRFFMELDDNQETLVELTDKSFVGTAGKLLPSQSVSVRVRYDEARQGARKDLRTVVSYRGLIGKTEGCASRVQSSPTDVSLLFVFDTSGSISTAELNQAKAAALGLLDNIRQGPESKARVALVAFASGVHTVVGFSDTQDAVRNAIGRLSSNGSTALYDAVVSGANLTAAEKKTTPDNQTVIVLFTDGEENASRASFANAVAAIQNPATCDDINAVFCVFVGGSGSTSLRDLSDAANRTFVSSPSFDTLKRAFLTILGDKLVCR
ncbi:MAG: VWA domain-containing protein [Planctomycetes bacterium]|nr:VWA domain-containing protein [Planctomycetota bacterium]MCB9868253.1 VWA domain-containing protein [Planctomycetota bacterium]MCB9888771.1 VWA domain-containing protein [Planctomycetota bacterium]